MWRLDRPKPALPSSYFWTWDHSTNWMLDDPGNLTFGCHNTYRKHPQTFVEDYLRLIDFAAGLGIKGIVIWGFLRDAHGGIDSARRVADYATSRNVAIMPGVGTTHYGGIYYQGDHPYNIDTFLRNHPDAAMQGEDGRPIPYSACPSHPAFQGWLLDGLTWLFREFPLGGINLENGDFMICSCPACRARQIDWPAEDPEFFRLQAMSYLPALTALSAHTEDKLITWATYTGFIPGTSGYSQSADHLQGSMHCPRPSLIDQAPPGVITQWTLTGMVRSKWATSPALRPLPLLRFLDDGAPDDALRFEGWPFDLRPPGPRSVGFLHQGSQWCGDRYECVVSSIKEGCLRAYRAGLEGISIHGEVTPRHVPWALNYLAFSHFTHWPEDTLRDFGRKTIGQVFGSERDGEAYIEALATVESGQHNAALTKELEHRATAAMAVLQADDDPCTELSIDRWRFWNWLWMMAANEPVAWMRVPNFF